MWWKALNRSQRRPFTLHQAPSKLFYLTLATKAGSHFTDEERGPRSRSGSGGDILPWSDSGGWCPPLPETWVLSPLCQIALHLDGRGRSPWGTQSHPVPPPRIRTHTQPWARTGRQTRTRTCTRTDSRHSDARANLALFPSPPKLTWGFPPHLPTSPSGENPKGLSYEKK